MQKWGSKTQTGSYSSLFDLSKFCDIFLLLPRIWFLTWRLKKNLKIGEFLFFGLKGNPQRRAKKASKKLLRLIQLPFLRLTESYILSLSSKTDFRVSTDIHIFLGFCSHFYSHLKELQMGSNEANDRSRQLFLLLSALSLALAFGFLEAHPSSLGSSHWNAKREQVKWIHSDRPARLVFVRATLKFHWFSLWWIRPFKCLDFARYRMGMRK